MNEYPVAGRRETAAPHARPRITAWLTCRMERSRAVEIILFERLAGTPLTAKALGLAILPALLARADAVIE